MQTIAELISNFAQTGSVAWIGTRPARRAEMSLHGEIEVLAGGLVGDHYSGEGKRGISLIQAEHLPVIAAFLGVKEVNPQLLRRNIVVYGINLLGLRKRQFRIGGAILEGSGLCAPCSRMEETLGVGGYAAVRGHGGITARVVSKGLVRLGDEVIPI